MKKKKVLIITLLLFLSLVLVTTGLTLAFFTYTGTGKTDNTITVGSISFHYDEVTSKGHGISITNATPVNSNDTAKNSDKYFEFRITSSTTDGVSIPYTVTARMNQNSYEPLGNIVDMYLTEVSGGETPTALFSGTLPKYNGLEDYENRGSYTEKVIYTDTVTSANYEKTFRLRMWIDKDANMEGTMQVKYFCGDTDVTESYYQGYECSEGVSPSKQNILVSEYNDKEFSITVNVNALGNQVSNDNNDGDGPNKLRTLIITAGGGKDAIEARNVSTVTDNLLATEDDDGTTYYFKGNIDNNWVRFADMLWRVTRINGDGSIRLALQGVVGAEGDDQTDFPQHKMLQQSTYDTYLFADGRTKEDNIPYLYYSSSDYAKPYIENWYSEKIDKTISDSSSTKYSDYVVTGKYCEALRAGIYDNVINNTNSLGYSIVNIENYVPTYKCQADGKGYSYFNGNVATLNLDDVLLAGYGYESQNSYLNNNAYGNNFGYFYLMSSPGLDGRLPQSWMVLYGGIASQSPTASGPLRPVINLNKDVTATGTGTKADPYVLDID